MDDDEDTPEARFEALKEQLHAVYKETISFIENNPEVLEAKDWGPRWVWAITEGKEGHEETVQFRHMVTFVASYGETKGCLFVGVNPVDDRVLH